MLAAHAAAALLRRLGGSRRRSKSWAKPTRCNPASNSAHVALQLIATRACWPLKMSRPSQLAALLLTIWGVSMCLAGNLTVHVVWSNHLDVGFTDADDNVRRARLACAFASCMPRHARRPPLASSAGLRPCT